MNRLKALRSIVELVWPRVAIILVGLSLAFAAYSCDKARRAEAREIKERAARQSAELEAEGWKKAASDRKPEESTPDIRPIASVPPKIAWRTRTVAVPFSVPSSPSCLERASGPVILTTGPEGGEAVDTAAASPLLVSADIQASLAPTATGQLHLSTVIRATLTRGDWSETKELPTESVDFRVHPDVERAWADYQSRPRRFALGPRSPRHWRTGLFAGVGLAVSPLSGSVSGGVLVGYGVSF